MADLTDPRPVLRQELSRVFKNQRVVRAFEKIFDLIPPEFINQQVQLDTITLAADLANSQAVEAMAAIDRLSAAVEVLAFLSRPFEYPDRINPGSTPPIDVAMTVTWTGLHTFSAGVNATGTIAVTGNITATTTIAATGAISGSNLSATGGANPSASVGLTAVNGTAITYMRSDGAPALSQAIAPTWTGLHTFWNAPAATNVQIKINGVVSKATYIAFQQSGVDKWLLGDGAASENNNFQLYNTAGVVVFEVNRTTSNTTFGAGLAATGTVSGSNLSASGGANPSASVGLAAVNGAAITFMRSDGAPALDVGISPTWSGIHSFAGSTAGFRNHSFSNSNAATTAAIDLNVSNNAGQGLHHGRTSSTWNTAFITGAAAVPVAYFYSDSNVPLIIGTNNAVQLILAAARVQTLFPFQLKGYTVATLPAGAQGDTAFVTDALAPVFLGAVAGGGAVVCPVFYNGAAWVAQ